jgi:VRR-NUC domain.
MKKNITLKELADALHAVKIKQHPTMPVHAVPRKTFSDRSANKFTTAIVTYLQEYLGYLAYRQSTEGRYRPGNVVIDVIGRARVMKGTFIPAAKKGLGDVTAVLKGGKYVSIEVKIGRDRQRDDQKKFETQLNRAGGAYILVHDWPEFLAKIKAFI